MVEDAMLSHRALLRRAKTYLRHRDLELFIPVLPPFERVAAAEIQSLGYVPNITRGGVSFHGDLTSVYVVNLSHRTGARVLLRVDHFLAQNYPMLYHHTRKTPWEALLGNCPTLKVRASFEKSRLRNKSHIADVVFDAISARLDRFGLTINHSSSPSAAVHARLSNDRCLLSLDTTGPHLHKRGYRLEPFQAPIRETTAAAILALAKVHDYDLIVDPFCGSGTIAIEADLLLRSCAPGIRRDFAVEQTPLHSPGTLAEVRRRLDRQCVPESGHTVLGFDYDSSAVALADRCASRAKAITARFAVADATTIDFSQLLKRGERGLIVTNVPYGIRIETTSLVSSMLERFSNRLRETASGWDFALICAPASATSLERLGVNKRLSFSNGGIPTRALFGKVQP